MVAVDVAVVPVTFTDVGDIVQLVPLGPPLQLNATIPVNPFALVTVTVELPLLPAVMD